MKGTGLGWGVGSRVVTRVSTRMAVALGHSPSRTTFAVGKLNAERSEIRVIEAGDLRLGRPGHDLDSGSETVH